MRSGEGKTPSGSRFQVTVRRTSIKRSKWHTKVVINHDLGYLLPHWELNHRTICI